MLQKLTLSFVPQERYVKKLRDGLSVIIESHQVLWEHNKVK